jgi:hypothetical protein
MFGIVLIFGCSQQTDELTLNEKEDIENEIRNIMGQIIEAVRIHDIDKMFQYCLKNENYMYAANGTISKGFDENYKIASSIHSDPNNQSFYVSYDELIIRVINRNTAMVIGDGYFNDFPAEVGTKSIKLVITFLFEKIDGSWQLTVGHESTPDNLF